MFFDNDSLVALAAASRRALFEELGRAAGSSILNAYDDVVGGYEPPRTNCGWIQRVSHYNFMSASTGSVRLGREVVSKENG